MIDSGLVGTAQVDSETTLLHVLDDAKLIHGVTFNDSVLRRGLKSMLNKDFMLENWTAMSSKSYDVVKERFVDIQGDATTADEFYIILCGQIFQKMLRTAGSKFKPKDRVC